MSEEHVMETTSPATAKPEDGIETIDTNEPVTSSEEVIDKHPYENELEHQPIGDEVNEVEPELAHQPEELPPEWQVPTIKLSPCIRHTCEELVWFAICLSLFFAVKPFFYWLVLPMLEEESQIRTLIQIVNWSIYVLAIGAVLALMKAGHTMLHHSLTVTPHHVEFREGILTTTSTKVNISKIRTVDVKQTLPQKALNIGTVSFASASTDGYEIVCEGVLAPYKLRAYIKHRVGVLSYNEEPGLVTYP